MLNRHILFVEIAFMPSLHLLEIRLQLTTENV